MNDIFIFKMFGKKDLLYVHFHQTISRFKHRTTQHLIYQVLFHLRDIDDSSLRHLFELLIINVSSIHSHNINFIQCCMSQHKGVIRGCWREIISEGTPSFACITVCTLMSPFFLHILGWRPKPLKSKLYNNVIVVESIIRRHFIHLGSLLLRL